MRPRGRSPGKTAPGDADELETSPLSFAPALPIARQLCSNESRSFEDGGLERGVLEITAFEIGPCEIGAREVRPVQAAPAQVGFCHLSSLQERKAEVSLTEVCTSQIGQLVEPAAEVCFDKPRPAPVAAGGQHSPQTAAMQQ